MKRKSVFSIKSFNYNLAGVTVGFLVSLLELIYKSFEVVVVDNDFGQASAALKNRLPFIISTTSHAIKIYLFRHRLLYSRRYNKGIKNLPGSGFLNCISSSIHFVKHAFKDEWKHSTAIIKALCWSVTLIAQSRPFNHPI